MILYSAYIEPSDIKNPIPKNNSTQSRMNSSAIIGMIFSLLAICAFLFGFSYYVTLIVQGFKVVPALPITSISVTCSFSIVGIILSHSGLKRYFKGKNSEGKNIAATGIIISYLTLGLLLFLILGIIIQGGIKPQPLNNESPSSVISTPVESPEAAEQPEE